MTIDNLPAWTTFRPATLEPITPERREALIIDTMRVDKTLDRASATAIVDDLSNDLIYLNSRYQVNCRKYRSRNGFPDIVHLSIKRIDKERVGPERYRDFIRIKNELLGPDFEAVEIYPAFNDEVDTANQYHLWVFFERCFRLPFGWHGQRLVDGTSPVGGKQEPL